MTFVAVQPPPGIFRNGTIYQAKGRWHDCNLMRFQQDEVKPIGGWTLRSSAAAFAGAPRALLSWRDNSNNRWISVGTSSKLYVQTEAGSNSDITPSGFTAGRADATQNVGYGGGTYGTGFYGVPSQTNSAYLPASVWTLDSWGEDLVGCCDTDGKIYLWTLSTSTAAAVVTNAPTGVASVFVTAEGFVFALGQAGDARRVAWCDQQNITLWAADATNQAGDFDLATVGTLQVGKALPSGGLILTDVDAWLASYLGAPLVYGFTRVGTGCGVVSKGALAAQDSRAAWMGRNGFWLFDGQAVQPLDCDVADLVFKSLNQNQVSKVSAIHLSDQGEIWWFYPSAAANECDSYVCWAYRESVRLSANIWTIGKLGRLCGSGKGVFPTPLMVDGNGYLYQHETGLNYDSATPYVETGPFEIGQGDFMGEVQQVVPDQLEDGDTNVTFYCRNYPNSPETAVGPYALVSPTDVLFQGREIRIRFTGAMLTDWRVGTMRLDVIKGDAF